MGRKEVGEMKLKQHREDVKYLREILAPAEIVSRYHRLILAAEEGIKDSLKWSKYFTRRVQAVLKDAKGKGGMELYRANKPENKGPRKTTSN